MTETKFSSSVYVKEYGVSKNGGGYIGLDGRPSDVRSFV
jgi:hypothetical protein